MAFLFRRNFLRIIYIYVDLKRLVKIVVQLALIMVKIVVQCSICICSISTIGKDRCTVTMESASDRRRRLARERLQRCNLADLKLFIPLAFSHSRSPAYVSLCM